MWIFTKFGFFSVVADKYNPGSLLIRARMPGDLDALKAGYLPGLGPITETPAYDYRFRASVEKEAFAVAISRMVSDINYTNFKNEVHHEQGARRATWYADVWSVMNDMQREQEDSEGRHRPR